MKQLFRQFTSAALQLFRHWGALLILLLLYLAMLGAIYQFFVTREATIGQLILSVILALIAPILFLVIQVMAARYDQEHQRAWGLLGGSLRDFWKALVISLPLILIAALALYLFSKPAAPAPQSPTTSVARDAARTPTVSPRPVAPKPPATTWQSVAVSTIEYLLFCLILPLAAIHLWIGTAREGLAQTFKKFHRILGRAFAPRSVVVYAIGFIFFAVVPYFLIVTRTPVNSPWLDAGLLVTRLTLAMLLSLLGWVVTVGALGRQDDRDAAAVSQPSQGAGHVPAEA
jgi:hypothetical protein